MQYDEKEFLPNPETSQIAIQQRDQVEVKEDEETKISQVVNLQEPQHLPLPEQHRPLLKDHDCPKHNLGQELLVKRRD